jgi:hypothetical protein
MNIYEIANQAGQRDYWLERFAALVEAAARADERAACCVIVYGLCESDNVAQRTVDAIKARETT